jgi:hypothetical protein
MQLKRRCSLTSHTEILLNKKHWNFPYYNGSGQELSVGLRKAYSLDSLTQAHISGHVVLLEDEAE